jgi:hypothetical protein
LGVIFDVVVGIPIASYDAAQHKPVIEALLDDIASKAGGLQYHQGFGLWKGVNGDQETQTNFDTCIKVTVSDTSADTFREALRESVHRAVAKETPRVTWVHCTETPTTIANFRLL